MNVVKKDEDHSISFSWNRQVTPEDRNVESTNRMISDVMATPRNKPNMDDMD